MEPLLEGILRSFEGSEADFVEVCFGRILYGNFHTKATSKKSGPPSGNFRPNPPPPNFREVPPGAFPGTKLAGRFSYHCHLVIFLFFIRKEPHMVTSSGREASKQGLLLLKQKEGLLHKAAAPQHECRNRLTLAWHCSVKTTLCSEIITQLSPQTFFRAMVKRASRNQARNNSSERFWRNDRMAIAQIDSWKHATKTARKQRATTELRNHPETESSRVVCAID